MEPPLANAHLHAQYVRDGGAQMLSATLFELLLRWAWMHHLLSLQSNRILSISQAVRLLRPQLDDAKLMHKTVSQVIFPETLPQLSLCISTVHYVIMVFITRSMDLQRCPLFSF
ncbi:hypothetical protein BYT27DRAFT_7197812 [Phlegmacium glaucopus]|nr:hypothetical protein BYT27DRAFT_7197812 [Phlegmacium glaucopus]